MSTPFFSPEPFLSANAYPIVPRLVLSNRMLSPISYPNQGSVCWLLSRRLWHLLVRVRTGSSLVASWLPLCASFRAMSTIFIVCMAMPFVLAILIGGRIALVTRGLIVRSGTVVNAAYYHRKALAYAQNSDNYSVVVCICKTRQKYHDL